MIHDEIKKQRGIMLTETAWISINELAHRQGLSEARIY